MSAEVDLTSPSAKNTFQCTTCPNTFTSASRLKRHEGAHSDQRPFECKICSKTFKYRDNMKTHEKMHKSPYPCQTCHREFISWQALKSHLISHSDERPFSCTTCGKGFKRRGNLNEHFRLSHTNGHGRKTKTSKVKASEIKVETEEAPENEEPMPVNTKKEPVSATNNWILKQETEEQKHLACSGCGENFTQSDHLLIHKWNNFCEKIIDVGQEQPPPLPMQEETDDNNIAGGENETSWPCSGCDQSFATASELSDHAKTHATKVYFVCKVCKQKFLTKGSLKRHQKKHPVDKPFGCALCSKNFVSFQTLQKHTLGHSKSKSGNKLDKNRNLAKVTMNNDENKAARSGKKSRQEGFSCKTCGKEFRLFLLLQVHEQQHPKEKYYCQPCDKSFRLLRELKAHQKSHESGDGNAKVNDDLSQDETEAESLADVSFTQVDGIADELGQDEQVVETTPQGSSGGMPPVEGPREGPSTVAYVPPRTKKPASSWRKRKSLKKYPCELCHKWYSTPNGLSQHMICHGEKKFHCLTCGKRFHYRHNLKEHERTHTGERPYACQVCSQRFTQAHCLKDHVARQHEGEPFACRTCHERFSRRHLLKQHQKVHQVEEAVPSAPVVTAQVPALAPAPVVIAPTLAPVVTGPAPFVAAPIPAPAFVPVPAPVAQKSKRLPPLKKRQVVRLYSCKVCSNNYGSSRQLEEHEKTHSVPNPGDPDKMFACDECHKSFRTNSLLTQHKRTHGERRFECNQCPMGFKFAHHLRSHQNTHSGHRPYGCSDCERRFTQIHVLRNHMLKEHGKMPYTCTICRTDFPNLQSFKQHESESCQNAEEPPMIVDPTFGPQDESYPPSNYYQEMVEPTVIVSVTDSEMAGNLIQQSESVQGSTDGPRSAMIEHEYVDIKNVVPVGPTTVDNEESPQVHLKACAQQAEHGQVTTEDPPVVQQEYIDIKNVNLKDMKTADNEPDQSFQDKSKDQNCINEPVQLSTEPSVQRSAVDNIKIEKIETKET